MADEFEPIDSKEPSNGYARFVKMYNINMDGPEYRLDIINSTGEQITERFEKIEDLEKFKEKLKNRAVEKFAPAIFAPGVDCTFIKL